LDVKVWEILFQPIAGYGGVHLSSQVAEIKRIAVPGQLGQKVYKTPYQ
jgi:hypothetical protein